MWGDISRLGKYKRSPKKRKKEIAALFEEWETRPARQHMFEKIAEQNDEFFYAQRQDVSDIFEDDLRWAATKGANIIIMIEAPQGEGKSYVALSVCTRWKQIMKEVTGKEIKVHFTFNAAQSREKFSKVADGDIIQQDEDSKMIGRGAQTAKEELQNLVETMRFTQKSLIICAPHVNMLPGMTTLLRPMARLATENNSTTNGTAPAASFFMQWIQLFRMWWHT